MYSTMLSLLFSNAATYYFAVTEHWSVTTLLITYWIQSVIIGIFQALRMIRLTNFSAKDVSINGKPLSTTEPGKTLSKWYMAGFFCFHYGFFHLIYLFFLATGMFGPFSDIGGVSLYGVTIPGIVIVSVLFFSNHLLSFFVNREDADPDNPPNIGTLMMAPYLRIIPMHLTLIIGLILRIPLELFVLLKTAADVLPHFYQHKGGFGKLNVQFFGKHR
jgi:hypothetical protein